MSADVNESPPDETPTAIYYLKGGDFFEKTALKGHHDHMICMECGTIIEFQCDRIEKAQNEMCAKHKFQPSFHDHRIFGLCAECR